MVREQRLGAQVKCVQLTDGSPRTAAGGAFVRFFFGSVAGLLSWIEERPDIEAKEMLKRLQAAGYGSFSDR